MSPSRSLTKFVCASCKRADLPQAVRKPVALRHFQTSSKTPAPETNETRAPKRNENLIDSAFGTLFRQTDQRTTGTRRGPQSRSSYIGAFENGPPKNTVESFRGIYDPKYKLHVYSTKHNTHMTLTAPVPQKEPTNNNPYQAPEPNKVVLSLSAGNIGFRKAGRGSYDAAFQLTAFVTKQIKERGLLREIENLEVVLRGFGAGREAVTKAILGVEGKNIRPLITSVVDSTRLKFGGPRSPKPRRLG